MVRAGTSAFPLGGSGFFMESEAMDFSRKTTLGRWKRWLSASIPLQLLLPGSLQRLPVDPLVKSGKTPYQVLQNQFDHAQTVSIRDVDGWYAGRCYYFDSPTKPVAALLAGGGNGAEQKALGPAFTSSDYKKIIPLVRPGSDPTSLDSMNAPNQTETQTATRKEIQKAVAKFADVNAYPVQSNNALVVEGLRTTELESRTYEIRKAKKFLILRMTCAEDTYCLNYYQGVPHNRVVAESGDSNVVCYYFKKL